MQRGEFLKIDIAELENHMRAEFPDKNIILYNLNSILMIDFTDDDGNQYHFPVGPQDQQLIYIINKYYDFTFNNMTVRHDNEVWFFYS